MTAADGEPVDAGVAEALGHLQGAALELIAAARATLDALEGVVSDPRSLAPLLETVTEVGRMAADAARTYAARAGEGPAAAGGPRAGGRGSTDPGAPDAPGPAGGSSGDGPGPAPPRRTRTRVERIQVS